MGAAEQLILICNEAIVYQTPPRNHVWISGLANHGDTVCHIAAWQTYNMDDHTLIPSCGYSRNGVTRFRPEKITYAAPENKICPECLDIINNQR